MRQGIVVQTSSGREEMIKNFLNTLPNKYKYALQVVNNDRFELGAIAQIYRENRFDEFIYLHDTCEVKTNDLFKEAFVKAKGSSVSFSDYPSPIGMYLGKYRREVLAKIELPVPQTKLEAVEQEQFWTRKYAEVDGEIMFLNPPLRDGNNFVTKFGRICMKLENDYLVKYKTTWHRNMIK
jgi:hypothetical protein